MVKSEPSHLYVIRKYGTDQYWCNSSEHGCGWNLRYPKQAFTKSELVTQLQFLLYQGNFTTLVMTELDLPAIELEGVNNSQCLEKSEVFVPALSEVFVSAPPDAEEKR